MSKFEDEINKISQTSQMDQLFSGITTITQMVSAYYSGLIQNGVPPVTARILTADYQEMVLFRVLNGDK